MNAAQVAPDALGAVGDDGFSSMSDGSTALHEHRLLTEVGYANCLGVELEFSVD